MLKPHPGEDVPFSRVRAVSPLEMDYAFVKAAYNDRNDPSKMEQWKQLLISRCFTVSKS